MKMPDVYVIGGGIAGLITACLKEAVVIDAGSGQPLIGPKYLYVTGESRKFLEILGLSDVPEKVIRCAAIVGDGKVVYEKAPDLANLYWAKFNREGLPPEHVMAEGKWTFRVYDIDLNSIFALLRGQTVRIISKVKSINTDKQVIELVGGTKLEYTELYSTIPLRELYRLCGIEPDVRFEFSSIHMDIQNIDDIMNVPSSVEIIYDLRPHTPYIRYTRLSRLSQTLVVTESPKTGRIFILYGKIFNEIGMKELDGIKLIGRYARWIPKYMIHDVLRDLGVKGE